jgi:hypothetical protein
MQVGDYIKMKDSTWLVGKIIPPDVYNNLSVRVHWIDNIITVIPADVIEVIPPAEYLRHKLTYSGSYDD